MHFPFAIRTRQEGTMMPTALPLFFLPRPVSGADTSSILCVSWLGGGSKYRRGLQRIQAVCAASFLKACRSRAGALAGHNSDEIKACLSRAFRMIRWR